MKFCSQCGTPLDGGKFCANCGAATSAVGAHDVAEAPTTLGSDHDSDATNLAASSARSGSTRLSDEDTHFDGAASSADGAGTPFETWANAGRPASQSPAYQAPWAASSGAAATSEGSAKRESKPRKKLPKPLIIGVAALLAVGLGAGTAYYMRDTSLPKMAVNPAYLGQQAQGALQNAPSKKWELSNEEIARAAGLSDDSYASVSLVNASQSGKLLLSVTGSSSAVVEVDEATHKVDWRVAGQFEQCKQAAGSTGWVCKFSANSDADASSDSTPKPKWVTLSDRGATKEQFDADEGDTLTQTPTGDLFITSGLPEAPSSSDDGATANSSGDTPTTIKLRKLNADGSSAWMYSGNMNYASESISATGFAGLSFFVVNGDTYVRGLKTSEGKAVVLDSKGQLKSDGGEPVLANDAGRPVTWDSKEAEKAEGGDSKSSPYKIGDKSLVSNVTQLTSPMTTDSTEMPLFNVKQDGFERLKEQGSKVDWKAGVSAEPVAYCGGVTIAQAAGAPQVWAYDDKGKNTWSGSLHGEPQFCWGGRQLITLDGSTVYAQSLTKPSEDWSADLGDGVSDSSSLTPTAKANGFVVSNSDGIAFWGL